MPTEEIVTKMYEMCKLRKSACLSYKGDAFENSYLVAIDNVNSGDFDVDIKLKVLVELWKFTFLLDISSSVDPRGDIRGKNDVLLNISKALDTETLIFQCNFLKDMNKKIMNYFNNPLVMIEENKKFHEEFPGITF